MVGEMHCHTHLSLPKWIHRQLPTPFALVDHAVSIGLDFVAIADHDSQTAFSVVNEYALSKGLVLIPAVEISAKSSKIPYKRPHILAYGVTEKVPSRRSVASTLAAIHAQGGIAVAAHPFCTKYSKATYMGDAVKNFEFDGIEVFNSDDSMRANLQSLALADEMKWLQFAGSDAHCLEHMGNSRIEIAIEKTTDWRVLIDLLKQRKYRIVASDFNHEHSPRERSHSSSIAFILHSLRGKAS